MDIANRIDLLFKTITKSDGSQYSYREVEELAGRAVTSTSIWKARTGKTNKPSQRLLQALSQAFQVPVSCFLDENVSSADIANYRAQYHSEKMVEQIALRSADLGDEGKEAILNMINFVRKAQRGSERQE